MAQLFISAAHKSSGKTVISLGLCAAWSRWGLRIQPFKKGPDYIDPMWLGRAAGRPCHNLDFYSSSAEHIVKSFTHHSANADLALIEGNKGLYDGLDLEGHNSNAALARLLGTPVVLVLDTRGTIRGIAPLLLGYQAFDRDVNIAGVILNQVGGARHEGKLRAVVERYTDIPVLGAVWRDSRLTLVERHLGLMPSNEDQSADQHITGIAEAVAAQVDLQRLQAIATQARLPTAAPPLPRTTPVTDPIRVGIAQDAAFGFYYPGDLEALNQAGAVLIPINTLHDPHLPEIDALFIGGGFPEIHMAALQANQSLRADLKRAIEAGLPTYAECGGLMYLSQAIRWQDQRCEMVGVIPADTIMEDQPQGRGYVQLAETAEAPWPRSAEPVRIAAHEFHHSRLEALPPHTRFAYQVLRGKGVDGQHDGIVYKNLLASYAHLRDTDQHHWTRRFMAFVRRATADRVSAPMQPRSHSS